MLVHEVALRLAVFSTRGVGRGLPRELPGLIAFLLRLLAILERLLRGFGLLPLRHRLRLQFGLLDGLRFVELARQDRFELVRACPRAEA